MTRFWRCLRKRAKPCAMAKNIKVKICGLKTVADMRVAAEAGAGYVGFVFFEKSPRFVTHVQAAEIAAEVPAGLCKVALTVNASDAELDAIIGAVPLDMLQLHGAETPERVLQVKERFGLPVMKAVGVRSWDDLTVMEQYFPVADQLLVDAKPPKGSVLPGGNGVQFDWGLVAGRRWPIPWMLAGGITADNVAQAVAQTGARQVDLSSAVERAPGIKDPDLIRAFLAATP